MSRITRHEEIIRKQEALALTMLKASDQPGITIDVQLDVFDKVGRWVAIKNKLEDEGAGAINDFKRRIQGEDNQPKHYPPNRRPKGWVAPEPKQPRLDALKGRLPHAAVPRGDDGDSGDSGDEGSAAA